MEPALNDAQMFHVSFYWAKMQATYDQNLIERLEI
jgi:hypothetical protein